MESVAATLLVRLLLISMYYSLEVKSPLSGQQSTPLSLSLFTGPTGDTLLGYKLLLLSYDSLRVNLFADSLDLLSSSSSLD